MSFGQSKIIYHVVNNLFISDIWNLASYTVSTLLFLSQIFSLELTIFSGRKICILRFRTYTVPGFLFYFKPVHFILYSLLPYLHFILIFPCRNLHSLVYINKLVSSIFPYLFISNFAFCRGFLKLAFFYIFFTHYFLQLIYILLHFLI